MTVQGVLAATLVKPGQYEIREYPLPDPAPGCVLVKMEMSGICGTDKHTFQGFITQYGDRQLEFPIIQGHENVATIAAIGGSGEYKDFEGIPLRIGDRVVVGANVCCGECYYCRHDFPYYCCEKTTDYGNNLSARNPPHLFGGWAQYMYIVPGSFLVKVPDELPSEVAVLTEIFAVIGRTRPRETDVGVSERVVSVRRHRGGPRRGPAGHVLSDESAHARCGHHHRRRSVGLPPEFCETAGRGSHGERGQEFESRAPRRSVSELTGGRGADVVIECAGVPQAVPEALELLRVGGLLVEAGNFSDLGEVPISPHRHLCAKNVRILGVGGEEPAAYGPSMRQMARYMKQYPLREFVTHRFGLRDVHAAMQKSVEMESMKVVLEPWK